MPHRAKTKSHCRRALAPIELCLILPVLAVLFLLMVTIVASEIFCVDLSIAARNAAWVATPNPKSGPAGELRFRAPRGFNMAQVFPADAAYAAIVRGGKVHAQQSARMDTEELCFQAVVDQLPEATREHTVVAGVWDFRDLPFELEKIEEQESGKEPLELEGLLESFQSPGFTGSLQGDFKRMVPRSVRRR